MLHRESQLGYRTLENPRGLIHPVRLFDGERYPQFAKGIQHLNCNEFNRIGEAYKKTRMYLKLQGKIADWVPQVAESIEQAPPWMVQYLTQEWLEDPIDRVDSDPSFQLPYHPFRAPLLV